jgi:hypothetical protein
LRSSPFPKGLRRNESSTRSSPRSART